MLTALALAVALLMLATDGRIRVVRYDIATKDFQGEARFACLSDLHEQTQATLLPMLRDMAPDAILLAGDIFDETDDTHETSKAFVRAAAEIAPVYYVTGNHEYYIAETFRPLREFLRDAGVITLDGDVIPFTTASGATVNLCGVADPVGWYQARVGRADDAEAYRAKLKSSFAALDPAQYNILLAHRPEYIDDYRRYAFDLVLSGHTHGGQARVPFLLNGLYAPDQGMFPRYAGGEYDFDGTVMIVSRGASVVRRVPRVFNRPELLEIRVHGR